jgi:hypothetical protein
MSVDVSFPEDYTESPKGFNTTRFSEHALDETEDSSDDVLSILGGGASAAASTSLKPMNKTVNESTCMDMTTFVGNGKQFKLMFASFLELWNFFIFLYVCYLLKFNFWFSLHIKRLFICILSLIRVLLYSFFFQKTSETALCVFI